MESPLHNMSAPPVSKIVIAPNRQSLPQLRFQLSALPSNDIHFAANLLHQYECENINELVTRCEAVLQELKLAPVINTMKATKNCILVDAPFTTLALMSKTIGTLFLSRRKSQYTYERLKAPIFFSQQAFAHLIEEDTLWLP